VNLLSGPTRELVRSFLERLFHLISPFCTAAAHHEDETQCEAPIAFLNAFMAEYKARVRKDRKYQSRLPPLTADDHEWLVSRILPLVVMEHFRELPRFSEFDAIAQLCPHLVISPVLIAVRHSLQHLHLKGASYQTLLTVAPTIISQREYVSDFFSVIEDCAPDDIDFMDTLKCSVVFELLSTVASSMTFADEHEAFVLRVISKTVEFAAHAVGDEYEGPLLEMRTMLECIVAASPRALALRIASAMAAAVGDLHGGVPVVRAGCHP
jgi:hypothetical protein